MDLVLIADSARTIIAAMEQGLGAGIIVSHLVADKLDEGSLVAINPGSDRLTNTIACVTLRNKKLSLAEKSFQNHFAMKIAGQSNLIIHN